MADHPLNPFTDPPLNKTDSEKADAEDFEETELKEHIVDEKDPVTYLFNGNYNGPDLNSSQISISDDGKKDPAEADRTETFLDGRNRESTWVALSAPFRDFGTRVVTIFESRPCFFVNVVLLSISMAFFVTCFGAFVPMSVEKRHLSGSLNDTTRLLLQCSGSFEMLQVKFNDTRVGFSQCLQEKDTAHKLIEATEREKISLKNDVADLQTKLAAQRREIEDLQTSLGNKVNSAASFWRIFSSSHAVIPSPVFIISSTIIIITAATMTN